MHGASSSRSWRSGHFGSRPQQVFHNPVMLHNCCRQGEEGTRTQTQQGKRRGSWRDACPEWDGTTGTELHRAVRLSPRQRFGLLPVQSSHNLVAVICPWHVMGRGGLHGASAGHRLVRRAGQAQV